MQPILLLQNVISSEGWKGEGCHWFLSRLSKILVFLLPNGFIFSLSALSCRGFTTHLSLYLAFILSLKAETNMPKGPQSCSLERKLHKTKKKQLKILSLTKTTSCTHSLLYYLSHSHTFIPYFNPSGFLPHAQTVWWRHETSICMTKVSTAVIFLKRLTQSVRV